MLIRHGSRPDVSAAAPWGTMPGQRSAASYSKMLLLSLPLCLVSLFVFSASSLALRQNQQSAQPQKQQGNPEQVSVTASTPRGIHLTLKDGTVHVVREYRRDGERVRYFSIDRHEWEELPAALVDWDATAKQNAEIEKAS